MSKDLKNIRGIIWDLDDTLYKVTPDLHRSMRESVARAVIKMGYDISYEDALALAEESQEKHRLTVKMLVDKFGIEKRDLHIPFHAEMDHTVTVPCVDLPLAFAALPDVNHVLMTHASRDWALRMLDHMSLAEFFEDQAILGLEDVNFEHKHDSDRVTKTSLEILGTDPSQTAFAEDRDYNLTIPHQMGLVTVLMDHPSQPRDLPPHVDYRFDRAADFLQELSKCSLTIQRQKKA
jgi:putative hydrolase of the HAD superfamily